MLDIRYEDEALLIVNKPPGILVHPTTKEDCNTLSANISRYYRQNGWNLPLHPVSRLDRQTSGLVVFAKLPEIQGQLIKQGMQKEYFALVTGVLPARHGIIDFPIARKPGSIIEREIHPEGKPCKTEYRLISAGPISLVRCRLYTGRTHQIRVHFAGIGCPLWHDNLYGNIPGPPLRHGLHACKIAFVHPWTRVFLEVTSALPEDLRLAWQNNLN
ncbi:MAG: RluA family pseudouridine synthase [Acidaminococcaceae bacterium]|nr:RluA family pseudouridine synthase [Acidaminococcaceae bacterium]